MKFSGYSASSAVALLAGCAAFAFSGVAEAAGAGVSDAQAFAVVTDTVIQGFSVCSETPVNCLSQGPASASAGYVILPVDDIYSGSGFATISGSPEPAIIASAALSSAQLVEGGGSPVYVTSEAGLTYNFEITATPDSTFAGDVIPVLMKGSFKQSLASGDRGSNSMSSVSLQITGPDGTSYSMSSGPTDAGNPFSQEFSFLPDTVYTVSMIAMAKATVSANSEQDELAMASASLDPIFAIGASCGCSGDFQFDFSPGVGNSVTAVPEPATWAMMLVGFGGLGARLRARRRALFAAL